MSDESDTLRAQQLAFAHHVRDPGVHPPPPGIEDRRLRVYRELFIGSMRGLLEANFPVIHRTLPDADWQSLVQDFYTGHRCSTPLFTEVAREFVDWLASAERTPPWLPELAHHEWTELALQIAEIPPGGPCRSRYSGDLLAVDVSPDNPEAKSSPLKRLLQVSVLARVHAYAWPVHQIGPDFQPLTPPATPTLLLARRDDAGDVHFSELSPLVFRLLQMIQSSEPGNATAGGCMTALAAEAGETGNDAFHAAGMAMIQRLLDEGTLHTPLC